MKSDLPRSGTLVVTCLLLLGACAPEDASTPSSPASTGSDNAESGGPATQRVAMAETAWLSVSEDGEVFTTFLDPDGRFRDLRDGAIAFTGTWKQDAEGRLCLTPDLAGATGSPAEMGAEEATGEQAEGVADTATARATCWDYGVPGNNGTMRATRTDGRAIELKRIAYTAPASSDADADGKAGSAAPRGN